MTSEQLKNNLSELGLSLKDFSELTNISYSTVSKYGKSAPVPPWAEPFLNLYKENLDLKQVKELIIELSEKFKQ
jgi:transcriptional regulator with XRE-family HTH domain